MRYHSTRNDQDFVTGAQAILQGLAPDGGLYVPESFPAVDFESWLGASYFEIAGRIFSLYFTDFSEEEMAQLARSAYGGGKFEDQAPASLHITDQRAWLELWRGPTLAFKDLALSALPLLMRASMEALGRTDRILILTATSGDTGKAAMEGFSGRDGVGVLVFYPQGGVSPIQEGMMRRAKDGNVLAMALQGDFDDCQTQVKLAFQNQDLVDRLGQEGVILSSANSINIGRLVPQIVYYVWSYLELVSQSRLSYGDPLQVVVPTGNFGDVLAAYYAKEMGLPLGAIGTASNSNKVLYDFARTGTYDRRRDLVKTSSPSMDILVSSNLERYLYLQDPDPAHIKACMESLNDQGWFTFDQEALYPAAWASEEEGMEEIRRVFDQDHYLVDPHTAVGSVGARKLFGQSPCLVVSTASPYKFVGRVLEALGREVPGDQKEALENLATYSGQALPQALTDLFCSPLRPEFSLKKESMEEAIFKYGRKLLAGGETRWEDEDGKND